MQYDEIQCNTIQCNLLFCLVAYYRTYLVFLLVRERRCERDGVRETERLGGGGGVVDGLEEARGGGGGGLRV